ARSATRPPQQSQPNTSPARAPPPGTAACCPRSATGVTAAPPITVMNLRRLTRSPRPRWRARRWPLDLVPLDFNLLLFLRHLRRLWQADAQYALVELRLDL